MEPEPAQIREWLLKARSDWKAAEVALASASDLQAIAAFHCQAIEKLLKAFLVTLPVEPPRTHDLRYLAEYCARHDATFAALALRVGPLTRYAVHVRYPGLPDPTQDDVQAALHLVAEVWDFILPHIPPAARPQ